VIGCGGINPDMLAPSATPLAHRLLPLNIGLATAGQEVRAEAVRTPTFQSEFLTVFERELEQNVFQTSRDRWGWYEEVEIKSNWLRIPWERKDHYLDPHGITEASERRGRSARP
ncbi:MAG: hypothetical protein V3R89_03190, partial [Thermoanaerobaculia bacterium]